jgi:hypothetical protein
MTIGFDKEGETMPGFVSIPEASKLLHATYWRTRYAVLALEKQGIAAAKCGNVKVIPREWLSMLAGMLKDGDRRKLPRKTLAGVAGDDARAGKAKRVRIRLGEGVGDGDS